MAPRISSSVVEQPGASRSMQSSRWQALGGALLIALLICVIYYPSLFGRFILDDDLLLTRNDVIKSAQGLTDIWFSTKAPEYYPLSYSSLWLEWRLWGVHPTRYRVTNLALHFASCLLLWMLLNQLAIPGAFLAALLFAVHPVNVESVAWIAQRRNVLAIVFLLASILCYMRDDDRRQAPGWQRHGFLYWLSLLMFDCAMLSKGSAATLPVMLLLMVWWRRQRIKIRDAMSVAPFFIVALVLGAVDIWFQRHGADISIREATFAQRLSGVGAVVWFYLGTALAPIGLQFLYPLWQIEPGNLLWWLPLSAAVLFTGVLLWRRNSPQGRWIRPLLLAWGFFCVALAPVLGFTDVGFMKYSLVADHYQHIALVGVVALAAAGWSVWHERAGESMRWVATAAGILVVGSCALIAGRQNWLYQDTLALYRATLEVNPNSCLAHNLYGSELLANGQIPEAIDQLEQAIKLNPDVEVAHVGLGAALIDAGRIPEAIDQYRQALKLNPDDAEAMHNIGDALLRTGQVAEAVEYFQKALRVRPELAEAYLGLGTAANMQSKPQEALANYEHALAIDPENARVYASMSVSYAQMHRTTEAISAAEKATKLARSQGQEPLAQQIEEWLRSYREALSAQRP